MNKNQKGNITLITVLVLTGVAALVSISLLIQTINFNKSSYGYNSRLFAESVRLTSIVLASKSAAKDMAKIPSEL